MTRRPGLVAAVLILGSLVGSLAVPASAQQPRRGGVLRMADREAPNLDPHLSISSRLDVVALLGTPSPARG